jgi:hypothetical protein
MTMWGFSAGRVKTVETTLSTEIAQRVAGRESVTDSIWKEVIMDFDNFGPCIFQSITFKERTRR